MDFKIITTPGILGSITLGLNNNIQREARQTVWPDDWDGFDLRGSIYDALGDQVHNRGK